MAFLVIYITHPDEETANKVANHLLDQRLVACGNIFPITSAYWWNQKIAHEGEFVSIVKTKKSNWEAVVKAVEAIHPYEVPCIMKIEAEANQAYEDWIKAETK
ncbi:MAG: divalent-cation tolerance protein CutA [Bacteroidota bacterium]